MLPLELALCLLPRHAFTLEGSSGLLESGSLLLEPSFRLLARALLLLERALLLLELPLCRGEGGIPLRQLDSQLLSLLGLLLGLALPRSCSLEGCAVLLEQSRRPLSPTPPPRSASRPSSCVPSAAPHPALEASTSPSRLRRRLPQLGALVQEFVPHNLQPVLQSPVVGSQGLNESVKGVVLVPVPVALGAQSVETVVPLSSSTLQLLSPAGRAREKLSQETHESRRDEGENSIQQKYIPGRFATRDLHGSAAPRSACC
jgi:hypothetical protein